MSKGYGSVERACLQCFDIYRSKWLSTGAIVSGSAEMMERDETAALASSIRRALAALRRKGVLLSEKDVDGLTIWTIAKKERRRRRRRERQDEQEDEQADLDYQTYLDQRKSAQQSMKRLAKLLGMLGSSHDGEVLSAARKIEQEREQLGKTWPDLLNSMS